MIWNYSAKASCDLIHSRKRRRAKKIGSKNNSAKGILKSSPKRKPRIMNSQEFVGLDAGCYHGNSPVVIFTASRTTDKPQRLNSCKKNITYGPVRGQVYTPFQKPGSNGYFDRQIFRQRRDSTIGRIISRMLQIDREWLYFLHWAGFFLDSLHLRGKSRTLTA